MRYEAKQFLLPLMAGIPNPIQCGFNELPLAMAAVALKGMTTERIELGSDGTFRVHHSDAKPYAGKRPRMPQDAL